MDIPAEVWHGVATPHKIEERKEFHNEQRQQNAPEQTTPLVELEVPCAIPDPIMQLDASCILLKAAAQRQPTETQWQTTLEAIRMLMEIDGLDDMVLSAKAPSGGFLRLQDLRSQLESVQAAFRGNQQEDDGIPWLGCRWRFTSHASAA
jgi:hypothetical protein